MKTRIEQGSTHVTLICSREVAAEIGSTLVSVHEGQSQDQQMANYLWRLGIALEHQQQFEEEEPTS